MNLALKIVLLLVVLLTGNELMAQNNLTYKQLIEEADLYLKAGDTGFARIDYAKAVTMNPTDEYPRLKLTELDRQENTKHRNDSIFEQSLLNAEKYFKARNYNLAQTEYKKSLELKPESEFIKDRLATISASASKTDQTSIVSTKTEAVKLNTPDDASKVNTVKQEVIIDKPINKTIVKENKQPVSVPADQKQVTDPLTSGPTPLQAALTQADEFFGAKDYENAVQRYQTALSLKPGDKTIKVKLTSTQALLDKQKKDQKAYFDIIIAAEKAVALKNTPQAISYYEKAALLKPDDNAVSNKLINLRDQLVVEQQLEKSFKDIISKADNFLNDNNLSEARKSYEQARAIKPEDKYTQDKLLEISKIESINEVENIKKYKETLVLAESLLNQEDYQGAYQTFGKASALQPKEVYPKQKMTELAAKIKDLEAKYIMAYNGYIGDANKAFKAKNWDIAMDNYLLALKTKPNDTLSANQMNRILGYLDKKLITTLTPTSPILLEGKEVKLPFKAMDPTKRINHYFVLRVKNSSAGTPRLYLSFGQDAQKNGGIIYRNLLKGGQYVDYVIRMANQDRWYRPNNNWISLIVEGGSLEIEQLKICADF